MQFDVQIKSNNSWLDFRSLIRIEFFVVVLRSGVGTHLRMRMQVSYPMCLLPFQLWEYETSVWLCNNSVFIYSLHIVALSTCTWSKSPNSAISHPFIIELNLAKVVRHIDWPTSQSLQLPSRPTDTTFFPRSIIAVSVMPRKIDINGLASFLSE